jgi:hypothetical protein
MISVRKSEFACCENGRRDTIQTRRFFLTKQLVGKRSTESAISALSWEESNTGSRGLLRKTNRPDRCFMYKLPAETNLQGTCASANPYEVNREPNSQCGGPRSIPHLLHQLNQTLTATVRPTAFRLLPFYSCVQFAQKFLKRNRQKYYR